MRLSRLRLLKFMKALPLVLLLTVCLSQSGCMTMLTLDAAQGSPKKDSKGQMKPTKEPQPAYYSLLPITFAGDIATLPCQDLWWCLMKLSCSCM